MKKSICFIGLDNYPIMNHAYSTTYIGGESVQQSLLARAFVRLGWDVSMIVRDHGQPADEVIDGVRILKSFRSDAGLPVIRFIHPKITSIRKCLREADAAIYYDSCADFVTGVAAHFCHTRGKKLTFRIAHDSDCVPGQQIVPNIRDRLFYEYGLKHASIVYAQTEVQAGLLSRHYGIASIRMPMAVEPPSASEPEARDIDVLWVNNIRKFKRPDRFLELVRRLPDYRFVMIGGPAPAMPGYFDEISKAASKISNLEFMGFVPYSRINAFYARARVFVNTSDSEGYPNSFLQAWIRGVPVVSFFDPGGVIAANALGMVPRNLKEMGAAVKRLLERQTEWQSMSQHVRAFAMQGYSPDSVARKYEATFA